MYNMTITTHEMSMTITGLPRVSLYIEALKYGYIFIIFVMSFNKYSYADEINSLNRCKASQAWFVLTFDSLQMS